MKPSSSTAHAFARWTLIAATAGLCAACGGGGGGGTSAAAVDTVIAPVTAAAVVGVKLPSQVSAVTAN
jgi:hypothetical protein